MTTTNNKLTGVWKWLAESAAMKFARETQSELRKVTWPTREEAMRLTAVVVVLSLTASIVLFFSRFTLCMGVAQFADNSFAKVAQRAESGGISVR